MIRRKNTDEPFQKRLHLLLSRWLRGLDNRDGRTDRAGASRNLLSRKALLLVPFTLASAGLSQPAYAAEKTVRAPAASVTAKESGALKTAIFAGGCFWGIEGVFSHVKGVKSAVSGYHGGTAATANYKSVTGGFTNHKESVRVVYDPKVVRYDELLRIFFSVGTNPTQLNRQGPDVGAHYRNALVPLSAEQRRVANAYIKQLRASGVWGKRIVTKIETYRKFYKAETYHQDYMVKNPRQRYIVTWDKPKVSALKRLYPSYYRARFQRG